MAVSARSRTDNGRRSANVGDFAAHGRREKRDVFVNRYGFPVFRRLAERWVGCVSRGSSQNVEWNPRRESHNVETSRGYLREAKPPESLRSKRGRANS